MWVTQNVEIASTLQKAQGLAMTAQSKKEKGLGGKGKPCGKDMLIHMYNRIMKIDETWYVKPEQIACSTSAGGIIVRLEKGQALIALVEEQPFGSLILPKGKVEPGETLEKAALREIQEEAGLSDLQLITYLGDRQRLSFNKKVWITVHYFLFITRQEKGDPTDREHIYTCNWFPLEALPEMLWPEQRQLLESCRERIAGLLTSG